MIVYPEELMAQRIKELEAENERLREVVKMYLDGQTLVAVVTSARPAVTALTTVPSARCRTKPAKH